MNIKDRISAYYAAHKTDTHVMALSIVAVVGIGSVLTFTKAAGFFATTEAESGTKSANAVTVSDATASGSSAVKFTGTTPAVPAQCANGGSYLWTNLVLCGWPGPSNTGYKLSECTGGVLQASTLPRNAQGVIQITTNNTTVSCQNITGCIEVAATNVTIKNNLIKGCNGFGIRGAANGTGTVIVTNGASATISNNELNGQKTVHACIWHQGVSMSATANNCYNVDDGMFSWADTSYSQTTGDQFTIKDNYFHDFTIATANGHIDGYQTEGAANGLIDHNTFYMTSDDNNSASGVISIWDSLKSSHDITVSNNLIAGGGFSIYAHDYHPSELSPSGGFSVTNTFFNNNKFSTFLYDCVGGYGTWFYRSNYQPYQGGPTDGWHRSGNTVLETKENVDNNNPHVGSTLCT